MLRSSGLISSEKESLGVRAVLNAAALTYVAAAVALVATLIYYLIRYGGILRR
jgi:Zn-dependent membrane protease YugP